MLKTIQNELSNYLVKNCKKRLEVIYNENCEKIDSVFDYIKENEGTQFHKFHNFYIDNIGKPNNISSDDYFKTFISKYQIRGLGENFRSKLKDNNNIIIDFLNDKKLFALYIEYFHNQQTRINNNKDGFSDQGCFYGKLLHLCYPNEYAAIDNAQRKLLNSHNNLFIVDFFIINEAYTQWIKDNPDKMKTIKDGMNKALLDIKIIKDEIEKYSDLRMLDAFLMGINVITN